MVTAKRIVNYEKISRVAEILKVISHPDRLDILEILEIEEPLSVSDIQQRLQKSIEQSMLSHHLIKLKDKGILRSEKKGMNVYYSLSDRNILSIFDCLDRCSVIS